MIRFKKRTLVFNLARAQSSLTKQIIDRRKKILFKLQIWFLKSSNYRMKPVIL